MASPGSGLAKSSNNYNIIIKDTPPPSWQLTRCSPMRSSVWKLHFRRSKLQLAWLVLFFSLFPTHLVQSLAGQQLPSHIPLIKIGGQSRVVAGVTLKGGRRRFSGVLTAGGAHGRGGGGLVPRTGCRGRIRPLGFVHLKPRGRDGSELEVPATLLSRLGMLPLAGGTLGPATHPLPGKRAVHALPGTLCTGSKRLASAPGHFTAKSQRGAGGCSHRPGCSLTALQYRATRWKLGSARNGFSTKRNHGLCSSHGLGTGDCRATLGAWSAAAGTAQLCPALPGERSPEHASD